jgi:hypothetical protein
MQPNSGSGLFPSLIRARQVDVQPDAAKVTPPSETEPVVRLLHEPNGHAIIEVVCPCGQRIVIHPEFTG